MRYALAHVGKQPFLGDATVAAMDSYEPDTHSFVVKIWLEEREAEDATPRWRGHITHVVSGERRYLKSLGELMGFVEGYLARMGVVRQGKV